MDFLYRAVRLTLLISLVVIPVSAPVVGVRFAIGFLAGALWSLANLWALKALITRSFGFSRKPRWQKITLAVVKFPLLYAVGCWLLLSSWSSPVGFLVGFSLWQICLVVSAALPACAEASEAGTRAVCS